MRIRRRLVYFSVAALSLSFLIFGPGPSDAAAACSGTPTFTQMPSVAAPGTYQQGVATGDFNEDGNQDLAFSNGTTTLVSVRLGDGAGGFSGNTDLANAGIPWGIAVGDYNADSNLDLAVMSNDSGLARIWLGDGGGNFSGPTAFATGALFPITFDAVDVNLDGNLDLLSNNISSNSITITYGNGDGTFGTPTSIPGGSGTAAATAADLNNDGVIDLASANYFGNNVSIRLGGPGGTFSAAADVPAGLGAASIAAADLNGDTFIDLVVGNRDANTLSVLVGDGTGAFAAGAVVPTNATPYYVVLADLNNDGDRDIVAVPVNSTALNLFLGDGIGGFTSLPGIYIDNNSVRTTLADFNNDGTLDLAVSNAFGFSDRIIIHLGGCSVPPDTTAPTTAASTSPAANGAGWSNTNVNVNLTADDNPGGGGVASVKYSATGAGPFGAVTVSGGNASFTISAEGQTTISYFATDVAGNVETIKTVTVRIDKTAPTISVTSPTGGNYLLNQAATVSFGCTDAVSGIGSCVGTTTDGGALDTGSIGSKTFTINSSDIAGNTASSTVNYTVGYGISVLFDQTKAHKSGSTVPIKIRLVDANGANLSSATTVVHAVSVYQIASQATTVLDDAGSANPDFNFRYDAGLGGYIFNLKTTGYGTGSYRLSFVVGNSPTVYSVDFQVRL